MSAANGLEKPRRLSLICTKLNGRAAAGRAAASSATGAGTPPASVQTRPVPAQLMHFRNPRRLSPPCSLITTSDIQEAGRSAARVYSRRPEISVHHPPDGQHHHR
ncbi:MAG TPA: hypothetical protein VHW60_23805 [Caulobacteraceae bacterium]|nr:hypothetical protein [Caulobacteraceae bacterium]